MLCTTPWRRSRCAAGIGVLMVILAGHVAPAHGQQARVTRANWALADRFNPDAMRSAVFSTSVNATFINRTDSAWYNFRDRHGSRFMLVVPKTRTKQPLFDHVRLAADLSVLHRKAYDPHTLPFSTITFPDSTNHSRFTFVVDSIRYEYDMRTAALKSLGRAPRGGPTQGGGFGGGRGGGQGGPGGANQNFRNFSPDSTAFVFAREHNLYLVNVAAGDTVQISTDGVKDYSFGARDTTQTQCTNQQQGQQQQQDDEQRQGETQGQGQGGSSRDPRVRAQVTWSPDSRAFYVTRTDNRKVADLYLINMLCNPRPALTTYRYPMPGEDNVRQTELYVYARAGGRLTRVKVDRYKDQSLSNIHWDNSSTKLRLIRRDRPRQNMELVEVTLPDQTVRTLLTESITDGTFEGSPVGLNYSARYVKAGDDFLWWSERTGWGHFYLYDHDGRFKHAITTGSWRAEQVVAIDSIRRVAWISGVGREEGENVYHQHLYRVNLDGTGLTLMDPGDANHITVLSPSRRWIVDTYSRPDQPPKSVVRDERGAVVLELEEMDLTRLYEMGWKPPETFVVKAADGVTDIYGNMWKPFDFDPAKKYPVIANVYPGPQTESVSTTFSATAAQQRLAQLGFIVIQLGNRGGSPRRSNAYQNFSFNNLRDYGLADKKAGIEQLAARHAWIDIDRVGLYGHSGGGFMTAAAMLLPPYNDFFKVGVASAGNHDNNVYGDYWAEQNHGVREVRVPRTVANGANAAGVQQEAEDTDVRFEVKVPANHELAANLKGRLLLVHGDMDNNVHPAGTIRLVDALIKANKRFDMMIMPGQAHGFGPMQNYFNRMLFEYFTEHLLGDYYRDRAEMR